jgi:hypothetical protein
LPLPRRGRRAERRSADRAPVDRRVSARRALGRRRLPRRVRSGRLVAGRCHELGVEHPWLARATEFCFGELEREPSDDAHALREGLTFLEHVPDRERAKPLWSRVAQAVRSARYFRADPAGEEYGLTPLHFAPQPDARLRPSFDDDVVAAHLDRLESDQQADGGWPLTWNPPSEASTLEWRGIQTLAAVRVLVAYGRLAA